jgi:5-methyltetrahydrofolate--homocysteine methyltransferase
MQILNDISESLQNGDHDGVSRLVETAIEREVPTTNILDDGLIAGMNVVGERFRVHEIFLPEVLLAARAMYAGMELLKPLLIRDEIPSRGKVVLGSVQGDLHDIGKNLVGIMLRGSGFEVIDLGNDVPPEKFLDAAIEHDAHVVGMSALLTTTMLVMKRVVEQRNERNLGDRLKIIVGGAPVSEQFAREIGADAFGFDAANAVEVIKKIASEGAQS